MSDWFVEEIKVEIGAIFGVFHIQVQVNVIILFEELLPDLDFLDVLISRGRPPWLCVLEGSFKLLGCLWVCQVEYAAMVVHTERVNNIPNFN